LLEPPVPDDGHVEGIAMRETERAEEVVHTLRHDELTDVADEHAVSRRPVDGLEDVDVATGIHDRCTFEDLGDRLPGLAHHVLASTGDALRSTKPGARVIHVALLHLHRVLERAPMQLGRELGTGCGASLARYVRPHDFVPRDDDLW
jgi:hypothetical protein